jgi:hypothetical protein
MCQGQLKQTSACNVLKEHAGRPQQSADQHYHWCRPYSSAPVASVLPRPGSLAGTAEVASRLTHPRIPASPAPSPTSSECWPDEIGDFGCISDHGWRALHGARLGGAAETVPLTLRAHPGDARFLCGGALAALVQDGWRTLRPCGCSSASRRPTPSAWPRLETSPTATGRPAGPLVFGPPAELNEVLKMPLGQDDHVLRVVDQRPG